VNDATKVSVSRRPRARFRSSPAQTSYLSHPPNSITYTISAISAISGTMPREEKRMLGYTATGIFDEAP